MHTSYESLPIFTHPIRIHKFIDYRSVDHIHWHEEIELLYFTEGEGVISCDLKEYTVKAGDIVFVNGKELHTGCLYGNKNVYYCIHVDKEFFHNLIGNEYVVFQNIISDKACEDLIKKAIYETQKEGFESLIAIKKIMYEFFDLVVRYHIKSVLSKDDYINNFKKLYTFNSIIEYIDRHFDEKLNVNILAKQFYMSPSSFSHLFKRRVNKTVTEYINEIRISHAKSFLEREDMSIGEIASLVGFSDMNYFSRKFKAITETTPSEYRRR
jgi:AraC-like DNA-binding protein